MTVVDTAMQVVHLVFAGVWVGSVVFVAAILVPAIRGERLPTEAAGLLAPLATLSRVSAVAILLSGGHLLGVRYGIDGLLAGGAGHLILAMVGLWVVFTGTVEAGIARLRSDPFDGSGRRLLQAAALVGVVLLVIGGLVA